MTTVISPVQVLIILTVALSTGTLSGASDPPHVLLIVVDDLGWNDIGYHSSEIATPFLDSLAYDGVKLENYYTSPLCTPSRANLMTGRSEIHLGLQHDVIHSLQANGLPLGIPTLADKLREAGYSTHLVGKWHLGHHDLDYLPTHRGFDTFFGFMNGMSRFYTHDGCESAVVNGQTRQFCGYDFFLDDKPYHDAAGKYSTDLFVQRSIDLAEEHAKNNPSKPLFLEVSFQSVHYPLEVPAEYEQKFAYIDDPMRRKYVAMVNTVDDAVKDIVESFKSLGLWENTLVIFTTDNGGGDMYGGNNYPLRGFKTTLWEGGVRGVGFVHGAGLGNMAGAINTDLIHISDWFPTLVHLAGLSTSGLDLDSYDVWHALSKNYPSPRTDILHNIDPLAPLKGSRRPDSPFDNRVKAALRMNDWKLLTGNPGDANWYMTPTQKATWKVYKRRDGMFDASAYKHEGSEVNMYRADPDKNDPEKNIWLFDINSDPQETNDLSDNYPDIVRLMLAKLAQHNSTAVPCRYPSMDPAGDPALHSGIWRGVFGPWKSIS